MSVANADQKTFDRLITLKRHLRSCRQCANARKAADPYMMCQLGLTLTLNAADSYDGLIKLRAAAFRNRAGTVIACPDASKHGQAYALTALPLHVTGIQDRLL
jgi:hypothetical protein